MGNKTPVKTSYISAGRHPKGGVLGVLLFAEHRGHVNMIADYTLWFDETWWENCFISRSNWNATGAACKSSPWLFGNTLDSRIFHVLLKPSLYLLISLSHCAGENAYQRRRTPYTHTHTQNAWNLVRNWHSFLFCFFKQINVLDEKLMDWFTKKWQHNSPGRNNIFF